MFFRPYYKQFIVQYDSANGFQTVLISRFTALIKNHQLNVYHQVRCDLNPKWEINSS